MSTVRPRAAVVVLLLAAARAGAAPADAAAHFAAGKGLVEQGVADAGAATRESLLTGIGELREAVRRGYAPALRAHRLVARAYDVLRTRFADPGTPQRASYLQGQLDALEDVMRLDPTDVGARLWYAARVARPAAALAAYDEVLARQPRRGDVLYLSALLLVRLGRTPQASERLERAADVMSAADAVTWGQGVLAALEATGRGARAQHWRPILLERAEAGAAAAARRRGREEAPAR